jgi:hypothetical protein
MFCAPIDLTKVDGFPFSLYRWLSQPKSRSRRRDKEKILLLLGTGHRSFGQQPIILLTLPHCPVYTMGSLSSRNGGIAL